MEEIKLTDSELLVVQVILDALNQLENGKRYRVVSYLQSRVGYGEQTVYNPSSLSEKTPV